MRILLLLALVSICAVSQPRQMLSPQVKLEVPDATWEPIFFKAINERARIAKLKDLRSVQLANDDLEIRVWMGFGVTALQGYVIKRTGGQWSGLKIPGIRPQDPKTRLNVLVTPKSGWDELWKSLTNENILTLPDSSKLPGGERFTDGISYVVEINKDKSYRTYMYGEPEEQSGTEAKQMANIARILSEEFGKNSH